MKKTPKKRNRAAQDATLINARAAKKRIEALADEHRDLAFMVEALRVDLMQVFRRLNALERKAAKRR